MRVDLRIEQPMGNRFIAHQSLVVAFRVGDAFFWPATIDERPRDATQIPIFVSRFFQQLNERHDLVFVDNRNQIYFDPDVWNSHGQTIIEATSALGKWTTQRGHSRDFLHRATEVLVRVEMISEDGQTSAMVMLSGYNVWETWFANWR